jgi:N-methylhydantoinase B
MNIDPVTVEVVASRLREATATMEHVLYHSGYSPILRESKDGTSGLTDRSGRVVMLSGGIQYHYTAYEQSVRAVLARYPMEKLRPGDSFICNDPYKCGVPHASDFCAITPAFHGDTIIGFGVSLAHKSDIGGIVPGSAGAAAREIYHDGIIVPPVLFQTARGIEEGIEAIVANNSRIGEVVLGDLRAQVGSTRIGGNKLAALCDEYGREIVLAVMQRLIEASARRLAAEFSQWADGEFETEGLLDDDVVNKGRPLRIHVAARKLGDRLTIDFTGSSPQGAGPLNVGSCTARGTSAMAILAASDPTIPVNAGLNANVDYVFPPASVVNPQHPATNNHYFPPAHVVYNTVLSALIQMNPKRAVAPSGLGSGAVTIGYRKARGGKPAVLYELLNCSLGGTSAHDGVAIVMAMNHFTPGAPVEIFESEYPLRVRCFDLVRDSAGAGKFRGGLGYAREFEVLEDSVLTVRSSNHKFASKGVGGGGVPRLPRVVVNPYSANSEELAPIETRLLKAGDIIRFERSGGAGFGDPLTRARETVAEDVRNGYVSRDAAMQVYGLNDPPVD